MEEVPDVVVKPVSRALVLDGNDLQQCPDCGAWENLRMCAIRSHAVVWCQRAWPYPTLTFHWLVENMDSMYSDRPSSRWNSGEPIPAAVLERGPGLDTLVETIEAVVAGGYVDSHRRLTDAELAETLAGREHVDRLPGIEWLARRVSDAPEMTGSVNSNQ
jgi:hypothetical protein